MKCETARILLVSLADHEPVGPRAGELTRHLEQCAECRTLLEALKRDREILRELPVMKPPDRLLGWVMTQVRQAEPAARPALPRLLRVAAIILLFLAGIALGVVIGYTISPKESRPIDRIAVLMMSEPTENQSEVQ